MSECISLIRKVSSYLIVRVSNYICYRSQNCNYMPSDRHTNTINTTPCNIIRLGPYSRYNTFYIGLAQSFPPHYEQTNVNTGYILSENKTRSFCSSDIDWLIHYRNIN